MAADPKNTEWPELLMTRRDPSHHPGDMSAFRSCSCGCQSEWMPYLPLQAIRERLLSDEAVEAALQEIAHAMKPGPVEDTFYVIEALQAAFDRAFPEGDGK